MTDQPCNYWLYHVSLPESHLPLLDPAHDEDTEEAGQQDPHGQGEDRDPRKLHGGQLVPQLCYQVSLELLLWAHGCCGGGDGLPLGGCLLCGGGGCGGLGHSHFLGHLSLVHLWLLLQRRKRLLRIHLIRKLRLRIVHGLLILSRILLVPSSAGILIDKVWTKTTRSSLRVDHIVTGVSLVSRIEIICHIALTRYTGSVVLKAL